MKKTQKILGLPVVSISDGLEVGKVKSIIINANRGAIDYIVVDSGIQIFSARVIPMEDVLGIGEYALTIENEGAITDISRIPEAIQLLKNDIKVKGTKVLTRKGRLIGEIGDIYIDEDNQCRIIGLEFIDDITQKQLKIIPRDTVITFGKNLTVVKDDIEASLLDTPTQLDPDSEFEDFEKKNNTYAVGSESELFEEAAAAADTYTESVDTQAQIEDEETVIPEPWQYGTATEEGTASESEPEPEAAVTPEAVTEERGNASVLYEQRQRQYLKGRYATRTITDNAGNVIISEGMMIDDSVIDEAKSKDKLIELVMNNKA